MKLDDQDFLDVALGATILGTGGGGSFESALQLAVGALAGRTVELVSLSDVPDDARIVVVAAMGSPEAMLKTPITTEPLRAFDVLSAGLPQGAQYVMPIETSGFNFLVAMTVAALRSIPMVDADPAGRAIPRLNQTLLYAAGVTLGPLALADAGGRSVVINSADYELSEKTALAALESFGWSAGLACYPVTAAAAKGASVSGTVSQAREVGKKVRGARDSGTDPCVAVLNTIGGRELIRGRVRRFDPEIVGSYNFAVLEVEDDDAGTGQTLVIKSMNENMVAWKGSDVVAAPDRICFILPDGAAVTNADIVVGQDIVVFAIPAQAEWDAVGARALFAETLEGMGYSGHEPDQRDFLRP